MAVTIAVTDRWIKGKRKHTVGTLDIASVTYLTGGSQLEGGARNKFGFVREVDYVEITGPGAGATSQYQILTNCPIKANEGMRLYVYEEEGTAAGGPLLEVGNATSLTDGTYQFHAVGW